MAKIILTDEQISEIAQDLEMGMKVFIHLPTNSPITIPDESLGDVCDGFEEEQQALAENPDDYFELQRLTSTESFRIMEDFVEQFNDKDPFKQRALDALSYSKPFRNFKSLLDAYDNYRTKWYAFRDLLFQQFIQEQLDDYNSMA